MICDRKGFVQFFATRNSSASHRSGPRESFGCFNVMLQVMCAILRLGWGCKTPLHITLHVTCSGLPVSGSPQLVTPDFLLIYSISSCWTNLLGGRRWTFTRVLVCLCYLNSSYLSGRIPDSRSPFHFPLHVRLESLAASGSSSPCYTRTPYR